MGGLFGGGGKSSSPVEIPKTESKATAPIDAEAAENAKTREAEAKLRKGRGSLRIDLASSVGSGSVGSGVAIAT